MSAPGSVIVAKSLPSSRGLSLYVNKNVSPSELDRIAALHAAHQAVLPPSDSHLTIDVSRLLPWMIGPVLSGMRASPNYTLYTGRDGGDGVLDHIAPNVKIDEGAEMTVSYDGGAVTHPAYGDFRNDSDALASVQSCRVHIRDIDNPLLMCEIWYSLLQLVPMVHPVNLEVDVKSCVYGDTMPIVLAYLKPALVTLDSVVLDHDWVQMIRDPENGISNLTLMNCDLQGCATLDKKGDLSTHIVVVDPIQ
jgi:hypothetical protein